MGAWEHVKQLRLLASVQASDGVRHQFTTLFDYELVAAFPEADQRRFIGDNARALFQL